jgi:hypothetical protein
MMPTEEFTYRDAVLKRSRRRPGAPVKADNISYHVPHWDGGEIAPLSKHSGQTISTVFQSTVFQADGKRHRARLSIHAQDPE